MHIHFPSFAAAGSTRSIPASMVSGTHSPLPEPQSSLRRVATRWMLCVTPMLALGGFLHAGPPEPKAEEQVDKRQYHLFNPTPREFMRDMSTDRPDSTESPITVDAGHFQVESSLFDYGRTRQDGMEEEVFTYGGINFKLGLLHNVDLQFVFDAHTEIRTKDRATNLTETVKGFSDLQVRLKINLWGNDGGDTALAIFPFVKLPTGSDLSNDHVEGGLILPLSVKLSNKIGLGLMLEADFVYDEDSRSYQTELFHTAVLGFDLTDQLGLFVEYAGTTGSAHFDYLATANAGFTFAVSDDLQLDIGGRVGLNEAAEDFGVFTGFSIRF
jgi:hypothetical protein